MKRRSIRTDYYQGHTLVKSTHASWAVNAVGNATKHLRREAASELIAVLGTALDRRMEWQTHTQATFRY